MCGCKVVCVWIRVCVHVCIRTLKDKTVLGCVWRQNVCVCVTIIVLSYLCCIVAVVVCCHIHVVL